VSEFAIHCTDCVTGLRDHVEPGSIDLTVTSIPFGSLFSYSGKTEDIGNSADGIDFVQTYFGLHLRFMCEALFTAMRPGRNVCIHIQQLLTYKIQHGYMGRRDFRGAVVDVFSAAGFEWKGEVAIPKNPQVIAQRQNLHSLMFVTGRRDSVQLAPAVNDYLMIFQRPGDAPPVKALRHEENPDGWVTGTEWIRWASGVWDDINETDVLEGWRTGRDTDDEKHVCPLQLEVIRRPVKLYSNLGDLVLDPFMGIGSTAHVALEQGRRVVGFELKESYHALAVRNAQRAVDGDAFTDQLDLLAG
jgi:DNA modification methylase